MSLSKLLTGALAVLPLSSLAAQNATPSDDGGSPPAVVWVSALGAASAGAALFAAFSRSSQPVAAHQTQPGLTRGDPLLPPAAPPGVPDPTGSTQPTGNGTPPSGNGKGSDSPPAGPLAPQTLFVPSGPETPPPNDPPVQNLVVTGENVATVPEPGALGLVATGIVGLIPLTRRRTRR